MRNDCVREHPPDLSKGILERRKMGCFWHVCRVRYKKIQKKEFDPQMTQGAKHVASEYQGYAKAFQDENVVQAYHFRAPYPSETFAILAGLIDKEPRHVLDVGCGTGNIARHLVEHVERLDAVDFSQQMIEQGKLLPNGDHPHLRWLSGRIEDVALDPPYALVTAGESLHWMDWNIVMPRFHEVLIEGGYLAIVATHTTPDPWSPLSEILPHYRTDRYQGLPGEMQQQSLFQKVGESTTRSIPLTQSLDDFIESYHSRPGFSRERMGRAQATAFDQEARKILLKSHSDGMITFQVTGSIIWGFPGSR